MIELLLQAERALSVGMTDQAERLYRQAADNDPRNAIAVVGLARVALERSDDVTAYREARRALRIDPENVAARRLVARLEEVFAARGEALPSGPEAPASPPVSPAPRPSPSPIALATDAPATSTPAPAPVAPERAAAAPSPPAPSPSPPMSPTPTQRRSSPSLIDRLLRRNRP